MEGLHGPGHCNCHAIAMDIDPFGEDLLPYINVHSVNCLNESEEGSCRGILKT